MSCPNPHYLIYPRLQSPIPHRSSSLIPAYHRLSQINCVLLHQRYKRLFKHGIKMWYSRTAECRQVHAFQLSEQCQAQAANFPFCTIEPNLGVITVPDERLNKLAEIVHPGRIVPATCEIVDIAGLVRVLQRVKGWATSSLATSVSAMPSSMSSAASRMTTWYERAVWLSIRLRIRKS